MIQIPLCGIYKNSKRFIVIEGVNKFCIYLDMSTSTNQGASCEFRPPIRKICGKNFINNSLLVTFLEFPNSVREKRIRYCCKNPACFRRFNSVAMSSIESPEESISSRTKISLPSTSSPINSCATIGFRPFTIVL